MITNKLTDSIGIEISAVSAFSAFSSIENFAVRIVTDFCGSRSGWINNTVSGINNISVIASGALSSSSIPLSTLITDCDADIICIKVIFS